METTTMESLHPYRAITPAITPAHDSSDELRLAREGADERWFRGAPFLLAGSRDGLARLPRLLATATEAALSARRLTGPLPAGSTVEVLNAVTRALGPAELPPAGMGADATLRRLAQIWIEYGLDLSHPRAAAHLQPPPLAIAVVADTLASISNASLDTYDSGPAGIAIERWLVRALAELAGLGPHADGVLTPGGSLSNMLGLLLARDAIALRQNVNARIEGISALPRPVVLCSELAHFSVHRACAALGLGEAAVRPVPTDERRRMRPDVIEQILESLDRSRETPLAIVATAGTTDFGSIDPLGEIATIAAQHEIWLHIDAAYGFGMLFSNRLSHKLAGIERADSITLDLHKVGWQPAAASVLLLGDRAHFGALEREVAYLNPSDDTAAGLDGLLGRSLQTTRRADALKVVATLLAHGRSGLGEMVDICHDLARYAAERIARESELELVWTPELTTVLFRYRCQRPHGERRDDEVNGALRRRLLERGVALLGRTAVKLAGPDASECVCLKLTLLNPSATPGDIDDLIHAVLRAGREAERQSEEQLT
jgi:L-2,4-diaminobutyrate decarboxylase